MLLTMIASMGEYLRASFHPLNSGIWVQEKEGTNKILLQSKINS